MIIRKDRSLLADAIARGVKTAAELAAYLRALESAAPLLPKSAQA
ncbi:hypothetical protein [Nitratifractor sp.]|nr:hypothetical protein [Nitratifractor sp.]